MAKSSISATSVPSVILICPITLFPVVIITGCVVPLGSTFRALLFVTDTSLPPLSLIFTLAIFKISLFCEEQLKCFQDYIAI